MATKKSPAKRKRETRRLLTTIKIDGKRQNVGVDVFFVPAEYAKANGIPADQTFESLCKRVGVTLDTSQSSGRTLLATLIEQQKKRLARHQQRTGTAATYDEARSYLFGKTAPNGRASTIAAWQLKHAPKAKAAKLIR